MRALGTRPAVDLEHFSPLQVSQSSINVAKYAAPGNQLRGRRLTVGHVSGFVRGA